jgi:7-cyano-7-deazaguanine synthase
MGHRGQRNPDSKEPFDLMEVHSRFDTIVVHSGGMDSSLCLAHAIREHGLDRVLSMTFRYGQRHAPELESARAICAEWGVAHTVVDLMCLQQVTTNALMSADLEMKRLEDGTPSTLVTGRNGLMARVAGIHANELKARCIYIGIIEVESANSGYRDCTRDYMERMQEILRIDFGDPTFEIRTPVVFMDKEQTMEFGHEMGVLEYLLDVTITCYDGMKHRGCGECLACGLRNEGLATFLEKHPDFESPFSPV